MGRLPHWLGAVAGAALLALGALATFAEDGAFEAELRAGLEDEAADFWIYDDIDAGFAESKRTSKPLLVSFRCVP